MNTEAGRTKEYAVEIADAARNVREQFSVLQNTLGDIVDRAKGMNQRDTRRNTANLPCSVNCEGNNISTNVIDLSTSGARLRYTEGFSLGAPVSVNIPSIGSVEGTVAHIQSGEFVGLSLKFSAEQKLAISNVGTGTSDHAAA